MIFKKQMHRIKYKEYKWNEAELCQAQFKQIIYFRYEYLQTSAGKAFSWSGQAKSGKPKEPKNNKLLLCSHTRKHWNTMIYSSFYSLKKLDELYDGAFWNIFLKLNGIKTNKSQKLTCNTIVWRYDIYHHYVVTESSEYQTEYKVFKIVFHTEEYDWHSFNCKWFGHWVSDLTLLYSAS